jgi:hypothetical protein
MKQEVADDILAISSALKAASGLAPQLRLMNPVGVNILHHSY